jgi:hypothetical protein
MKDAGELYQLSSVYRHFILNKYAVVRGRFDTRSAKSYYLCTIVLFDISKDSDVINSYELLSGGVVDQHVNADAEERIWIWRVKGTTRESGTAARRQNCEL